MGRGSGSKKLGGGEGGKICDWDVMYERRIKKERDYEGEERQNEL